MNSCQILVIDSESGFNQAGSRIVRYSENIRKIYEL